MLSGKMENWSRSVAINLELDQCRVFGLLRWLLKFICQALPAWSKANPRLSSTRLLLCYAS